jgi:hypothetical protein
MESCPNCGRPFDGHMHAGDPCDVCEAKHDGMADPGRAKRDIARRLEHLRSQIQAESISYGEIAELQALAPFITAGDVELLEWAGVPEDDEGGITPEGQHWATHRCQRLPPAALERTQRTRGTEHHSLGLRLRPGQVAAPTGVRVTYPKESHALHE